MGKSAAIVVASTLVFGAFSYGRSMAPDNLYHGVKVNTAAEERDDPWWQQAQSEVVQASWNPSSDAAPEPKILRRGSSTLNEVALTFDDGPHPGKVEKLLGILNDLNVKATFFVVGKMVEKHPELVKMEADAGHEVDDHSFSHVNLSKVPENQVEIEYAACKNLLHKILGHDPQFCRPPGGQATPDVMIGAAKAGLETVMWTDDPKDYSNPGPSLIVNRTFSKVKNGGIILLHEGVDQTMQVLPTIVNTLRDEGYKFVTVGELVADTDRAEFQAHHHSKEQIAVR